MELTKSEMEIMDVMWEAGAPMSRSDLLAHSEEKTWKDSSVHILLNGLLQKGAIQEAGLVKRSKTYGRNKSVISWACEPPHLTFCFQKFGFPGIHPPVSAKRVPKFP